ncbi:hypothetical protein QUB05_26325 [Microcoleus sp. F10-C6]|uniref:hypothetical protein n=1 Tax=unclassified Microcoleus TaxID=2642155 RepID=UPI002FD2598D
MVSPKINIAGLHKVSDFPLNEHQKVVDVVKIMPHQLEFYVYQGKFTLYVQAEDIETAKILLEISIE